MSGRARASHERRLVRGRKIRSLMSTEMRALSTGKLNLEDALRDPPDALGRYNIYDVLRRTPKLGKDGARRILVGLDIWPLERLADIPYEKRGMIIASLPERVKNSA